MLFLQIQSTDLLWFTLPKLSDSFHPYIFLLALLFLLYNSVELEVFQRCRHHATLHIPLVT